MEEMASNVKSKPSLSKTDFSCSVCQEVFKDPIVLSCSHSFCRCCLDRYWKEKKSRECPLCRVSSPTATPSSNQVFKDLCEAFLLGESQGAPSGSAELCHKHGEKRKLFCLEDEEPICLVCHTSKRHKGHDCSPIDEAALEHKNNLKTELSRLEKKLEDLEWLKDKDHGDEPESSALRSPKL